MNVHAWQHTLLYLTRKFHVFIKKTDVNMKATQFRDMCAYELDFTCTIYGRDTGKVNEMPTC